MGTLPVWCRMIINVEGGSRAKQKFIFGFAQMLAKELKIEKYKNELIIYIKPNLLKERSFAGVSGMMDGIVGVGIDSKLHFDRTMSTLAHEMVHVKQLLKGVLRVERVNEKDIFYWKGKEYPTDGVLYVDRPWELEAYSQQEVLVRRITGKLIGEDQVKVSQQA